MALRIIGICGYKGAGKTTVARYLVEQYGFERVPMATPIKAMLSTLGLTEAQVDGADKEVPSKLLGGKTPRWALQSLGTEWGRKCIGPSLWLRAWARRISSIDGTVVVDDFRFPNENEYLIRLCATLWRVERASVTPRATGLRQILRMRPRVHASEAHIPSLQVHQTLPNNRSVSDLYHEVECALHSDLR